MNLTQKQIEDLEREKAKQQKIINGTYSTTKQRESAREKLLAIANQLEALHLQLNNY